MNTLKEFPIIQKRFDGGMVNDPRDESEHVATVLTNFDVFTDLYKLTPYRSSVSGEDTPTEKKQNFCIAYNSSDAKYYVYGLGFYTDGGGLISPRIKYKRLAISGAAGHLADAVWASTAANQGTQGSVALSQDPINPIDATVFVFYQAGVATTGAIYGIQGARYIYEYKPNGSGFTDGITDLNTLLSTTLIKHAAQGIIHSKDNILYLGADNYVLSKNGTGSFAIALTLPSYLYVTSICEDGNYLVVAAAPVSGVGNSVTYHWDRDSNFANIPEITDWGRGQLKVVDLADGVLVGISIIGGLDALAFNTNTVFKERIIFRYRSGSQTTKFKEFIGTTGAGAAFAQLPQVKQKVNNRLFFMMRISLGGTIRDGVWSLGRSSPSSPFSVVHERTPNNDTAMDTTNGVLSNFINVGDYLFIAFVQSGASPNQVFDVRKTDSNATYSATSIAETVIKNLKESWQTKKLKSVTVFFDPLPAGATVVLKYKADSDSSFTQIFTYTSTNAIRHTSTVIESNGATLPQFKEITFRIESTGGAIITGYKAMAEMLFDDVAA